MGPLTSEIPKALVNVAGKTLVEWAIERYTQSGIDDVVLAVGWKGDMIEQFVSKLGFNVKVVHVHDYETGPLQTLLTAIETFDGDFLLSPVDAVIEPASMVGMLMHHLDESMTLAVDTNAESGTIVECGDDGLLASISDVGLNSKKIKRSAMLLISHTQIRDLCRSALNEGKERVVHLLERLINNGNPVRCYDITHSWYDIDRLSDLFAANRYLLQRGGFGNHSSIFVPSNDSIELGDSLTLKSSIILGKGTTLQGPILIASNCQIGKDCKLGPNVTIDSNTIISKDSEITDAIIFGDSKISARTQVHRSVIYRSNRYDSEV
jgi:NDP-sugar pyrophosphorylase family protein